jgi:hypothetical protein
MTPSKFMWVVIAGRGHSSEELGRGFTGDLDEAKAKVNEHAEQLRAQRGTDWAGWVLDLDKPARFLRLRHWVGWKRVYFVEGRDWPLARADRRPGHQASCRTSSSTASRSSWRVGQ